MSDESGGPTTEQAVVWALAAEVPAGWKRIDAAFALTVGTRAAAVGYSDGRQDLTVDPSESLLNLAAEHRRVSAASGGPWWRMLVTLTGSGKADVGYDYGEEPFPESQLLPPEAYLADLEQFPRDRVPVWLGAYTAHGQRQRRGARQAAAQVRADRDEQVWAVLAENEFPPLPIVRARWATISAAFVAVGSEWGPRILSWGGIFEGAARSGSTLATLPHGRAVLSGGVWNSPELDAVYNENTPMPEFYAGAPGWVTDEVLNPRAAAGLLSFCYWWDAGRWYRGESPPAEGCAAAIPAIWTAAVVRDIVTGLVRESGGTADPAATTVLISAAESGAVTRTALDAVFGVEHDIDGAFHQYALAGLVSMRPEPMPAEQAISYVRDYITGRGLDTTGYPLAQLTAERFSVGWMLYVPVPDGEMAIGRAVFYVADDGTLEHSTSSSLPATVIAEHERAFAERYGPREDGASSRAG
ncbi:hypothetical protein [Nocardia sp. NBC_00416]|uniref:hypothetical protein n=1 Tax=Nocardia sp. NBC_00416 TaxID=2975991 RepID=UPI002E21F165